MTDKFVVARNTVSGQVGSVPAEYLDHPVFGDQLELVDEGAKNYVPEMYKPKTARKSAAADSDASVADKTDSDGTDKNEEK